MRPPTKLEVDEVLSRLEVRPTPSPAWSQPTLMTLVDYDVRRLPRLTSMEFTDDEKVRLRAFMHQATRFRRTRGLSWLWRWTR